MNHKKSLCHSLHLGALITSRTAKMNPSSNTERSSRLNHPSPYLSPLSVLFLVLIIQLCSDLCISSGVEGSPVPSSAWNQPALAINTINTDSDSSLNGKPRLSNGGDGSKSRRKYSWNTLMHYGLNSDHGIRHRTKKLRDNSQLPCPFDQIRGWDGKCRQAPRFSLYRVG